MEHGLIGSSVKDDSNKITETIVNERRDSRIELTDKDAVAASKLGFAFSDAKKWAILTVIFWVQISMNYNAAIYGNAVPGMSKDFGISHFQARLGQMAFLVAYGFGCEFWAPFSEELGRKWIMQASLGLVNIFQIPCMLSNNFNTVLAARVCGGLSSAGGSVTLGMVADMFGPENQQFAMLYVVFSSCAGSVVAPIVGGFITQYLDWRWVFYTQLIFGAVVQVIHLFSVPETRASVLLDHEAQRRRKSGEDANVYGPNEIRGNFWKRLDAKHVLKLMWRPYLFLLTEPVVAFLSLLSGFSDALIFTGLDSFALVLGQWEFTPSQVGLSFIP
jgi:MFS family permease